MKFGKFEYPIKASYVSSWTVLNGMREIIANAIDAEVKDHARKEILYLEDRKTVRIINRGITLDRNSLLFGGSKKEDDRRLIGQYGEGLKLALLVLVRSGINVKVKNGRNETWIPSIVYNEKWDSEVLTIDIQKASRQLEDFEVRVEGLDPETWEAVKDLFLFMFKRPASIVETRKGQMILDEELKGRVYVKGVYVTQIKDYRYGYNFFQLDIGRDRQIPHTVHMEYEITQIHQEHLLLNPTHRVDLYDLMLEDRSEADAFKSYSYGGIADELAVEFKTRHGEQAIPCSTTEEVSDLKYIGLQGVLLPRGLAEKIQQKIESPSSVKAQWRSEPSKRYTLDELTEEEHVIYLQAIGLIQKIVTVHPELPRVTVVDFKDEKVKGTHQGPDIRISRRILKDFGTTLETLIHEYAHDYGPDGTVEHIDAISVLTLRAFNLLYTESMYVVRPRDETDKLLESSMGRPEGSRNRPKAESSNQDTPSKRLEVMDVSYSGPKSDEFDHQRGTDRSS